MSNPFTFLGILFQMDALDSPTITIAEAASKGYENKMNQQVIPGLDTSIVKSLNTTMDRVSL